MKKFFISLLFALLALSCTSFASAASGTCGDNLTWEIIGGTLKISGTGEMDNWEGYPSYAPWSYQAYQIYDVEIEEGVTSIGDRAFYDICNLNGVIIPRSLKNIGERAFDCIDFIDVNYVGTNAEWDKIIINENNNLYDYAHFNFNYDPLKDPFYGVVPDNVYDEKSKGTCGESVKWKYYENNSLTIYGSGKMRDWDNTIFIPWGDYFREIDEIRILDGVESIGDMAFINCSRLKYIVIPSGVSYIGWNAFDDCKSLDYVYFTGTKSEWDKIRIKEFNEPIVDYAKIFCKPGGVTDSEQHIENTNIQNPDENSTVSEVVNTVENSKNDSSALKTFSDNKDLIIFILTCIVIGMIVFIFIRSIFSR